MFILRRLAKFAPFAPWIGKSHECAKFGGRRDSDRRWLRGCDEHMACYHRSKYRSRTIYRLAIWTTIVRMRREVLRRTLGGGNSAACFERRKAGTRPQQADAVGYRYSPSGRKDVAQRGSRGPHRAPPGRGAPHTKKGRALGWGQRWGNDGGSALSSESRRRERRHDLNIVIEVE